MYRLAPATPTPDMGQVKALAFPSDDGYLPFMAFVSLTRLRIRSFRFLPFFAAHTLRSIQQIKSAPGFRDGALLADRDWTFWTMTAWDSRESMRSYMTAGAHRTAMPHLMQWCDEASVAHWDQLTETLPAWDEADRRMRATGRISKVRFPSGAHATLTYRDPRLTTGGPIRPAQAGGNPPAR